MRQGSRTVPDPLFHAHHQDVATRRRRESVIRMQMGTRASHHHASLTAAKMYHRLVRHQLDLEDTEHNRRLDPQPCLRRPALRPQLPCPCQRTPAPQSQQRPAVPAEEAHHEVTLLHAVAEASATSEAAAAALAEVSAATSRLADEEEALDAAASAEARRSRDSPATAPKQITPPLHHPGPAALSAKRPPARRSDKAATRPPQPTHAP